MKIARYGLLTAAGLFGLLVATRAIGGPLSFPVPVRTPINIESICGLCLVLALAIRMAGPALPSAGRMPLVASAALLALVAAAFWRALQIQFLADDFVLVTFANSFQASWISRMLTTGGGDGFFRPAGYLSIAFTALWAKFDPAVWHVTALALH